MDDLARESFLAGPFVGVLSLVRADGSPRALPVWYRWDGERVLVWTDRRFPWVARLLEDPRVAFAVFEHEPPFRAVYIDGAASVREGSVAALREDIRGIVARYRTPDDVERTIDAYDHGDLKAIVTITPTSIRAKTNLQ